jgi:hypothetical protein
MSEQPLCFVLMPFGSKPDPGGGPDIDFDRVYAAAIKPGIDQAGMRPVRADEEQLGGIIHKAMFERLLVCDYAVADLTTSNPNVMYELGVRHAARPRTTLTVYATSSPLPFDVRLLRTQPYRLATKNAFPDDSATELRDAVTRHLVELRAQARFDKVQDSPLFQLITGWHPEPLPAAATESFQSQVEASEDVKERLQAVRAGARSKVRRSELSAELADMRAEISAAGTTDPGVLSEHFLAHRALADWPGMIEVYEAMPDDVRTQVRIRQQAALAYNRRAEETGSAADRDTALFTLRRLEEEQGANSETSGLLGRVYKSQWAKASEARDETNARKFLLQAVDAYVRGFQADWRDIYPGINALTLLDIQGGTNALRTKEQLLPVVRFAVDQRLRAAPDYWDRATALELAVLADDREAAFDALDTLLVMEPESWQPKSTAGNLRIIRDAREGRGQHSDWLERIIDALDPPGALQGRDVGL